MRDQIDRIDRQIVALLAERWGIARAIIAKKSGSIEDLEREAQILGTLKAQGCGYDIEPIYKELFRQAKNEQTRV